MLIDNKGRIFGKLNIIDLCILVIIAVSSVFIFQKILAPSVAVRQDDIILEFFIEEAPEFAANAIQIGGEVVDDIRGVDLGAVIDVELGEGFKFIPTADGRHVRGYMEGYNSIKITTSTKGQFTDNGVIIAGNRYNVGHGLTLRAGQGKVYGRVSGAIRGENNVH